MEFLELLTVSVSFATLCVLALHARIFVSQRRDIEADRFVRIRVMLLEQYTRCINESRHDHKKRIKELIHFLLDLYDEAMKDLKKREDDFIIHLRGYINQ